MQVTRTTIKSRISSKLGQIQPWTAELAALDQLKKSFTYLRAIQNNLMTCCLSGEQSLPFGLLVRLTANPPPPVVCLGTCILTCLCPEVLIYVLPGQYMDRGFGDIEVRQKWYICFLTNV